MKNRMKNIIAICMVAVMAVIFAACVKQKTDVPANNTITDPNATMAVNGKLVENDVFEYMTNMMGVSCVESLLQTGMLTDVADMNWDAQAFETAKTYKEYVKDLAKEQLTNIYAILVEGEKRGIVLTEEDEKEIASNIEELKTMYGDEYETVLKNNGYQSEDTLVKLQRLDTLFQKTLDDAEKNLSKYVSTDELKANSSGPEKVTVKHILVAYNEENSGEASESEKAAAKKEAEEVLKKINEGGDFDKLMEEYNDDPGATPEGYTFADDGTMVQEFTDASFALEVGATSGLVETPYGYHIIRRLERKYTIDDYMAYLVQNADVELNEENYSKAAITIDLGELFGASAE